MFCISKSKCCVSLSICNKQSIIASKIMLKTANPGYLKFEISEIGCFYSTDIYSEISSSL